MTVSVDIIMDRVVVRRPDRPAGDTVLAVVIKLTAGEAIALATKLDAAGRELQAPMVPRYSASAPTDRG